MSLSRIEFMKMKSHLDGLLSGNGSPYLSQGEMTLAALHLENLLKLLRGKINPGVKVVHRENKVMLDDAFLKTIKILPDRYDVMDTEIKGFGVRVIPSGTRSFILRVRIGGSKSAARRTIGYFPEMSTEEARITAVEWRKMIAQGIDPSGVET